MWLKQSTAITFRIGPFVDQTDGFTAETALTLARADYRLSKAGGAYAQKTETTSGAHDENGYYTCILDSTDTNTLGKLDIAVNEAGALPVFVHCMVLPAQVWDSLFGADLLQVHAAEISASLITATSIAADAFTAAKFAADVTTELQSGLATAAALTTVSGKIDVIDDFLDTEIGALTSAIDIIDNFLDTEMAAVLAAVDTEIATIVTATGAAAIRAALGLASANLDTQLTAIDDFLDTEIAAILAAVDTEVGAIVTATGAAAIRTALGLASANLDTQLADLPTNAELATSQASADDATLAAIAALNNLSAAQVNTEVDTALTDYDGPTNAELATALGTADNAVLAILGTPIDTDLATDISNISAGGGLDAAGVRAAVGLASANLDTQLADLPTNAELATSQASADDATLAAIAGISAGSGLDAAGVRAAVGLDAANLDIQLARPVPANVTHVNDIEVTGLGTAAFPWKPV